MQEKVEGTLVSFVSEPRQGIARTSKCRKPVFLPGMSMRKLVEGKMRHFNSGEERPIPLPNSKLVMDISSDGKNGFIANNWAVQS